MNPALLVAFIGLSGLGFGLRHRAPPQERAALGVISGVGFIGTLTTILTDEGHLLWGFLMAFALTALCRYARIADIVILMTLGLLIGVMGYVHDVQGLLGLALGGGIGYGSRLFLRRYVRSRSHVRVVPYRVHVFLCSGLGCQRRGADLLYAAMILRNDFRVRAGVRINRAECLGRCSQGPIVWLEPEGTLYVRVRLGDLIGMVEEPTGRNQP